MNMSNMSIILTKDFMIESYNMGLLKVDKNYTYMLQTIKIYMQKAETRPKLSCGPIVSQLVWVILELMGKTQNSECICSRTVSFTFIACHGIWNWIRYTFGYRKNCNYCNCKNEFINMGIWVDIYLDKTGFGSRHDHVLKLKLAGLF